MSMQMASACEWPHRRWRSAVAFLAGFVAIVVLSLGTDQVLHALDIYPPWGEPMHSVSLNLLALTYRIVYGVIGSCLTARLAPDRAMAHALALGGFGFVLSTAGAIAMWDFGPNWYPLALAVTALPCAWLGGIVYRLTV